MPIELYAWNTKMYHKHSYTMQWNGCWLLHHELLWLDAKTNIQLNIQHSLDTEDRKKPARNGFYCSIWQRTENAKRQEMSSRLKILSVLQCTCLQWNIIHHSPFMGEWQTPFNVNYRFSWIKHLYWSQVLGSRKKMCCFSFFSVWIFNTKSNSHLWCGVCHILGRLAQHPTIHAIFLSEIKISFPFMSQSKIVSVTNSFTAYKFTNEFNFIIQQKNFFLHLFFYSTSKFLLREWKIFALHTWYCHIHVFIIQLNFYIFRCIVSNVKNDYCLQEVQGCHFWGMAVLEIFFLG